MTTTIRRLESGRLKTDTSSLKDIITDIRRGEVKIPKFQRRFVWNTQQALDLLDSICNNYPIGSVLLWKTPNKLVTERNIGDFHLPTTDDITPTNYVLDGQQRLTVIYSCLGAPVEEKGFAAGYDLEKTEFVKLPETYAKHIFPLRFLFETSKLLDFRTALNELANKENLQKNLDLLIDVINGYKVPVVTLRDLTVEEVCPIFERINSSGTPLSTYDLMVAATWSKDFDLNDGVESIKKCLDPKDFGDIDETTILKCICAINSKSVKKNDILKLRELGQTINVAVDQCKASLLRTVDFLSTEFKTHSWDFLPYEATVIILSSIFHENKGLNSVQLQRARRWFWISAFSERYQASEAFISKDIELVNNFVSSGTGNFDYLVPSTETLQDLTFHRKNSRSKAFILALATLNPRNILSGASIDTSVALSDFNKKQFHHVYPKAYLDRVKSQENPNSLLNICFLSMQENNRISDQDPNVYIPNSIVAHGNNAKQIFKSNLLPDPTKVDYSKLTYKDFLQERSKLAYELITELCDGRLF